MSCLPAISQVSRLHNAKEALSKRAKAQTLYAGIPKVLFATG